MSDKVLLISSGDWADEMDLEGFAIFSKKLWEKIKEHIVDQAFDAYYGSNEFVTFEGREDYLSYITEKEVVQDSLDTVLSLLGIKWGDYYEKGGFTYGLFVLPELDTEDGIDTLIDELEKQES